MLGVNEIKSDEEIPSDVIVALCDSLLVTMEEPDMRRLRRTSPDEYMRTLKMQYKRLDDRYPGIFNVLVQYGAEMPDGTQVMAMIKKMLGYRDNIASGAIQRDTADKAVDYELAHKYVRPAIGEDRFDSIVSDPEKKVKDRG